MRTEHVLLPRWPGAFCVRQVVECGAAAPLSWWRPTPQTVKKEILPYRHPETPMRANFAELRILVARPESGAAAHAPHNLADK